MITSSLFLLDRKGQFPTLKFTLSVFDWYILVRLANVKFVTSSLNEINCNESMRLQGIKEKKEGERIR